jgi:hypothetical protein
MYPDSIHGQRTNARMTEIARKCSEIEPLQPATFLENDRTNPTKVIYTKRTDY